MRREIRVTPVLGLSIAHVAQPLRVERGHVHVEARGLREGRYVAHPPQPFVALYCATRAGANALIRAAGLAAAPHGVTVNGTGTYGMDYPSFLHDVGADTDPAKRKEQEDMLPIRRLVQPEDAAHFVASLIDGKARGQTAQFFSIDGGWAFM